MGPAANDQECEKGQGGRRKKAGRLEGKAVVVPLRTKSDVGLEDKMRGNKSLLKKKAEANSWIHEGHLQGERGKTRHSEGLRACGGKDPRARLLRKMADRLTWRLRRRNKRS